VQKFKARLKNVPTDTPLVCSSTSPVLNRLQRVSVQDKVQTLNTLEVDHSQHRGSSALRVQNIVYVLNMRGEPLMPTTQQKANRLLKENNAKVVSCLPFTIKLKRPSGEAKDKITLGVDSGYEHIGISAITDKKELYAADVELRKDIVEKISERRQYRRTRRNKLWYRQPRFSNRKINKGWLAPSIQHKLDSHVKLVAKVHKILPISNTIIEIAKFDIQKIKNPDIQGKEYQEGPQKDFDNVKAYVLYRDNYTCQACKKKDIPLKAHHIESRQTGGNRPENLIALCKSCHDKYHQGKIELKIKKIEGYKAETFMSVVKRRLISILKEKYRDDIINETYGYITKKARLDLGLEKSHVNDSFCIAGGKNQERCHIHQIGQKRRNNRAIQLNRKGFEPSIRKQRYSYQPKDIISYKGKLYSVIGTHNKGKYIQFKNGIEKKLDKKTSEVKIIKHLSGFYYVKYA
jgi:RRXRR protein/HNH endonuclease